MSTRIKKKSTWKASGNKCDYNKHAHNHLTRIHILTLHLKWNVSPYFSKWVYVEMFHLIKITTCVVFLLPLAWIIVMVKEWIHFNVTVSIIWHHTVDLSLPAEYHRSKSGCTGLFAPWRCEPSDSGRFLHTKYKQTNKKRTCECSTTLKGK